MLRAIVKTGGKQIHVAEGDVVQVEKLPGKKGDSIELNEVLLISGDTVTVGEPVVSGAKVRAKIVRQARGQKIIGFKFKRRKGYAKRWGHRQSFTEIKVEKIEGGA